VTGTVRADPRRGRGGSRAPGDAVGAGRQAGAGGADGRRIGARSRRPPVDHANGVILLAIVAVLIIVGLVMVLSASSVQSQREVGSTWSYFGKQLMWVVVSVGALLATSRLDYRRWTRLSGPFLAACTFLLLVVLVPGIGDEVNGAQSWLALGPMRMQPSELVKLAVLLHAANLLARRYRRIDDWRLTLLPVCVLAGGIAFLIMLQPDLGTTIVLGSITFAVLFVSGVPLLRLVGVGRRRDGRRPRARPRQGVPPQPDPLVPRPEQGPAQHRLPAQPVLHGDRLGRLDRARASARAGPSGASSPTPTPTSSSPSSARSSASSGRSRWWRSSSASPVFGTRAALMAPDRFGTLVAAGVTAWILTQAFVNVGGVVGLLPITGLTLPFISFGGPRC
jgi:cell division protein FtsW